MYLLYADDAGNTGLDYENSQQPIFNLAGIIVPAEQWHELNQRVLDLRNRCFPEFPKAVFHATYIFNGSNDKQSGVAFHEMDFSRRLKILSDAVDMIVSASLTITHFPVKKQNLKLYCKRHFGNMVRIDPYYIAMPYVMSFFNSFLTARETHGIIFLDRQDELIKSFDNVQERIRIFSRNSQILKTDHVIERAMFLESPKSNFVQMADVANYFITRKLLLDYRGCNYTKEKDQFVLDMYNKLSPLIMKPPYDPTIDLEPLQFFRDNYELLK